MKHQFFLILHLLAASIWVGGHLLLAVRYLPEALKKKEASILINFKNKFEFVGIPSLLILLITGIVMTYDYGVLPKNWFSFSNNIEKIVSIKLILLFVTILLAINAQVFIFPKLKSNKLFPVAFLIISVTIIGITMLVLGSFVRIGGL